MKKNRPGTLLTVLVSPDKSEAIQDSIFAETTSFGIRRQTMERCILDRELVDVSTSFGPVTVKIGRLEGKIVQRAPEFAACRALAQQTGVPLRDIFSAASEAAYRVQ